MSDIFREVDEALQREKASKLWKEYGPILLLSVIVLIVATAGITAYRSWDTSADQKETAKLLAAVNQKDLAPALEKAGEDTRKGHEAIALLNAASAYAEKKDFTKAQELYGKVAQDSAVPSEFRDLATLLQGRTALIIASGKDVDYKAQLDKVLPIAKNDNAVFQLQAKLDAAVLYGDGLKDYTAALDLLSGFDKESVSDSLQEKANALKHVYEFERSKLPAAKPPEEMPAS